MKLQQTLERLAGLLRSESRNSLSQYGLQPVQFEVLSYLLSCNRYSDTPMAVTEFLGQTKGTVSQTLNVLEKKGLIIKMPDENDKRVTRLKTSSRGASLVEQLLPSSVLKVAGEQMSEHEFSKSLIAVSDLLYRIQKTNSFKSFGQCFTCVHNSRRNGQTYCGLTDEPLSDDDVRLICREHSAI